MVKPKTLYTNKHMVNKKGKNDNFTNLCKKNTISKNLRKKKIMKIRRQPLRGSTSCSSCSCSSKCHYQYVETNYMNQVGKKYNSKRKSKRIDKKQKKKRVDARKNLSTFYECARYKGSNKSVGMRSLESITSHIHVVESSSDNHWSKNRETSSYSLSGNKDLSGKMQCLPGMEGIKLLKGNADGSSTEIKFQPALLMRIRKMPATINVQTDKKVESSSVNLVKKLLGEVSNDYRGLFKCNDSNLLKIPYYHNHSGSKAAILEVKSSQNSTDLNLKSKITRQRFNSGDNTYSSSKMDILEIVSPQFKVNSSADINSCQTRNGFNEQIVAEKEVSTNTYPYIAHTIGHKFSQLQNSQFPSSIHNVSEDGQSCSHNTIITPAVIHQ